MPNLHTPYKEYKFDGSIKKDSIFIQVTFISQIQGVDYRDGYLSLSIHRLKYDRYQIHYANEHNWKEYVEDYERVACTPLDQLREAGEVFDIPSFFGSHV